MQTVIDAWVTISGNLRSEGDVQIEGKVCGDVHCVRLVIGKESEITGDIVAEEAVVRGKVKGMIRANRVVLQDTACVEGDIFHKALAIDEGASFEGKSCRREVMPNEDVTTQAVKQLQAKAAEGKRANGSGGNTGAEAPQASARASAPRTAFSPARRWSAWPTATARRWCSATTSISAP